MAQILRQSTQVIVVVGPFVDVGDGFTPETGITLGAADEAELLKGNTSSTTDISGATWAAITGCDGWYALTLSTSHTDTVGALTVMVNDDSVCLPVFARFQVIEEAAFDALYAASADPKADINVATIDANAITATAIQNGAITADKIATGAIDADAIADGAIDAGAIADNAITAAKIANGAIDAATFAADVDAEILSYLVDDATRIDASALNTLSSHDPGEAIMGATDLGTGAGLTTLATQASVNTIDGIVDAILEDTGTTLQAELDGIQADTEDIQSRLPAALTGAGNMKADMLAISDDAAAANALEAALDGTGTTTLTLKQLAINNNAGSAIVATSSGGNGHGLDATGHGTGSGVRATSGEDGHGVLAVGGGAGHGVYAFSGDAGGSGVRAESVDSGHGIEAIGGATVGNAIELSVADGIKLNSADYTGAVVDDAGNSASAFLTDLAETADDHWIGAYLKFTSGDLAGQVRKVTAYNGTTKVITVTPAFTAEPAADDAFDLVNE